MSCTYRNKNTHKHTCTHARTNAWKCTFGHPKFRNHFQLKHVDLLFFIYLCFNFLSLVSFVKLFFFNFTNLFQHVFLFASILLCSLFFVEAFFEVDFFSHFVLFHAYYELTITNVYSHHFLFIFSTLITSDRRRSSCVFATDSN